MDLKQIEWSGVDQIHVTRDGDSGGLCGRDREPSGFKNCVTFFD